MQELTLSPAGSIELVEVKRQLLDSLSGNEQYPASITVRIDDADSFDELVSAILDAMEPVGDCDPGALAVSGNDPMARNLGCLVILLTLAAAIAIAVGAHELAIVVATASVVGIVVTYRRGRRRIDV